MQPIVRPTTDKNGSRWPVCRAPGGLLLPLLLFVQLTLGADLTTLDAQQVLPEAQPDRLSRSQLEESSSDQVTASETNSSRASRPSANDSTSERLIGKTEVPPSRVTPAYSIRRNVIYKVAGHRKLRADVYQPNGSGPFPGVLLLHGGGWKAGSRKQMIYHAKRLAPNGYVAFAIDYRLAPQYKFPTQIEDCRDAVRYMREHAEELKIDPQRVAAYGYSAGGHLACLLGTQDAADEVSAGVLIGSQPVLPTVPQLADGHETSDSPSPPAAASKKTCSRVQVVIAGGAPCDFEIIPPDEDFLVYWLGGTRAEVPALYRTASPLAAATADDAPVLFYHGEKDTLVPTFSALRMKQRLDQLGVRTAFHVCETKGHYRAFLDAGAFQNSLAFLNDELKKNPEATATPSPPGNEDADGSVEN